MKTATGLTKFSHQFNKTTGVLVFFFGKNEGISFPDEGISSIFFFRGIKDGSGTRIGHKMVSFDNLVTEKRKLLLPITLLFCFLENN